jgi:transposase InsO family protein
VLYIPQQAEPLYRLRKKDATYTWNEETEIAFRKLKVALTTAPVLRYPNFNKTFYLFTDASHKGLGAVLMQKDNDTTSIRMKDFYPILYLSRTLGKSEINYGITELEALAVVWAVKKVRPYVEGTHFKIVSDHSALKWFSKSKDYSGKLARWAMSLCQFDFEILHIAGKDNVVADNLSRNAITKDDEEEEILLLTDNMNMEPSRWLQDQENDKFCQEIKLSKDQRYEIRNGMLCRKIKNRLAILVPECNKQNVLEYAHGHLLAMHFGYNKAIKRIENTFWWPTMTEELRNKIKTCTACIKYKHEKQGTYAWRKTVGARAFQRIAIDIWGPVNESRGGNKYVTVIQDTFTKWVHVTPIRDANTISISSCLMQFILTHGLPSEILSDNGPTFTAHIWTTTMQALGITHITSPAYHPQSNGLIERFMSTLRVGITTMMENISNWDTKLPFLAFAYNTTVHSSTLETPFYLTYGRDPEIPIESLLKQGIPTDHSESYLRSELIEARHRLGELYKAQNIQFITRTEHREYTLGTMVALRNNSPSRHAGSAKLQPLWLFPYKIIRIISPTTYSIRDKEGKVVENVHISRLKKVTSVVGLEGRML